MKLKEVPLGDLYGLAREVAREEVLNRYNGHPGAAELGLTFLQSAAPVVNGRANSSIRANMGRSGKNPG
ncbi:MAG: hypothetical protein RMK30_10115 [Anaerolineae bacterium]|nr:hypothetical protein [Anaerolineae bacterium]MDW8103212.1 hypothetical protein [Anaerolineae bacterium]